MFLFTLFMWLSVADFSKHVIFSMFIQLNWSLMLITDPNHKKQSWLFLKVQTFIKVNFRRLLAVIGHCRSWIDYKIRKPCLARFGEHYWVHCILLSNVDKFISGFFPGGGTHPSWQNFGQSLPHPAFIPIFQPEPVPLHLTFVPKNFYNFSTFWYRFWLLLSLKVLYVFHA